MTNDGSLLMFLTFLHILSSYVAQDIATSLSLGCTGILFLNEFICGQKWPIY